MKPILTGSTLDPTCEAERVACFGREPGGFSINTAIMSNYKNTEFALRLTKARDNGQIALVWFYPDHSTINQTGFHPDQIPNHPDTLAVQACLDEHCAQGGLAVCTIMDEMEQYQKWGGAVYKKNFDLIAQRFPQGCYAEWCKSPNPAMAKYGGPLKFEDWRPMRANFRGVHLFADCVDSNSARGYDVLRFLNDPATTDLPTTMLCGGFSLGNILDPSQAKLWIKQFLAIALNETYDVRICAAPFNQDFSPFPGIGASNGRYAPGAHQPPGDKTSPPWPGSPEMCNILQKSYNVLGQWIFRGDPILDLVLSGQVPLN